MATARHSKATFFVQRHLFSGLTSFAELESKIAARASATREIFFSIGTSTVVYPAASLPFEALRNGATVVEINPQPTPFTGQAQFVFTGAAGVVLPELLAEMKSSRPL